jgi:glutaredoxin 3
VVIYSKTWCPYCTQCKELLDSMGQPYAVVELDRRDDGEAVQAALLSLTQQRTVPSVFVAGKHIGGNDDTQAALALALALALTLTLTLLLTR